MSLDIGLPELLIILVLCCLPIGLIGGRAVWVRLFPKKNQNQNQ